MEHKNRIADHVIAPTPEQIEAECEMIRAHWSPEIKEKRKINYRIDTTNQQVQANIRFLRFLADFADMNS